MEGICAIDGSRYSHRPTLRVYDEMEFASQGNTNNTQATGGREAMKDFDSFEPLRVSVTNGCSYRT